MDLQARVKSKLYVCVRVFVFVCDKRDRSNEATVTAVTNKVIPYLRTVHFT